MTENVLIPQSNNSRGTVKNAAHFTSAISYVPIAITLALPLASALVIAHLLFIDDTSNIFIPPIHTRLSFYDLAIVGFFFCALLLGFLAQKALVVRPLSALRAWFSVARENKFQSIPIVPRLGRGDVGALGHEVTASLALFSGTQQSNTELTKQKSELLTIAAHQLRTPMTGVRWGVERLIAVDTSATEREALATQIDMMLKRMVLIVDNIVISADIAAGSSGYVFAATDIVDLCNKLVTEFQPLAATRSLTLVFEHGAVSTVRADSYRLSSAIFNILSNAVEYTPPKGTVTMTLKQKEKTVECSISDTGIGIPEREMGPLFSKFYRGASAKHMRPDGSGLGLFLVKNILASHDSDIAIRSTEGKGTTVSFELPIA